MRQNPIVIRPASPEDGEALLDIYAPYVRETAISFEYDVPSPEEFRERIRKALERYPYLAAEAGGELLGYACAGPFKSRAAYGWAVETSIYLRRDKQGLGLGRRLYGALEELSRAQGVQSLNACIACPETEDPCLTWNSVNFHAHLGFRLVGVFYRCGYKFGTWYNMACMEKLLGNHPAKPEPIIPFPELPPEQINTICNQFSD